MTNQDPVEALYERAAQHNMQMYAVCDRANVARSTPSRWRSSKNGATFATLKRLNSALDELIEERGHGAGISPDGNAQSPGKSADLTAAQQSEAA